MSNHVPAAAELGVHDHPAPILLKRALQLSVASIVWTLLANSFSIGIGIAEGSLVLVAFGFTGLLDAAGSAALAIHFRHLLRGRSESARSERIAFRIVTIGLVIIGGATAAESVRRLIVAEHGHNDAVGLVVAGTSIAVLGLLAAGKYMIGRKLGSVPLTADGVLSATGSLLAAVTLAGSGAASVGAWWADPAAALAVGIAAIAISSVLIARNRTDTGHAGATNS